MLPSTKKTAFTIKILAIGQIISIVLALVAFLIGQFAVGKEKLGFSPVALLFITYFCISGIITLIYGIKNNTMLMILIGGVSLVITVATLFGALKIIKWWIILIISVALIAVICVSAFISKADMLVVEFDNAPDSGRKTYAETKAEKVDSNKEEPTPELPEIKSFKD